MDGEGPLPGQGRLRRTAGVWSNPVQDRVVLYNSDDGKAIVLNGTGAKLWEALESPRTPSELAALLRERFPHVPVERATADVAAFLQRLLGESVLEFVP
jgi:hypothetical protein